MAVWQRDDLVAASHVQSGAAASLARGARWDVMARALADYVGGLTGGFPLDFEIVIEVPQVYAPPGKNDPNDLIDLAGVVGAVIGKLATVGGTAIWTPRPREWKGNAPKRITTLRVHEKLTATEKALIPKLSATRLHNVLDAIHLGLVHLRR